MRRERFRLKGIASSWEGAVVDFVGIDPRSPQDECPAVYVDPVTGDFYQRGHQGPGDDLRARCMVITEAAAHNDAVQGMVYLCACAPEHGESALDLTGKFAGSTLGEALVSYPVSTGGNDLVIRSDVFHQQFAADVPAGLAATMCATQRPVAEAALVTGLPTDAPAWRTLPSWFVIGDQDHNIPVELQRFMAERAGALGTREVAGASHALAVSNADKVTAAISDGLAA